MKEGRNEGRKEGRKGGRKEGRKEGRKKGREEGGTNKDEGRRKSARGVLALERRKSEIE
jgi:flagellar biosynthesis/type III secretory pathway protein FliH